MNGFPPLLIELFDGEAPEPTQLAKAAYSLRRELLECGAESVELPEGQPAPGAKAAHAMVPGTLILTLASLTLPRVINVLRDWCTRREQRRVVIKTKAGSKLELTGAYSAKDVERLLARLTKERHRLSKEGQN